MLALLLLAELMVFRHQLFQGTDLYFQFFRDPNPIVGSYHWYQYQSQALAQGFFALWNPWRGMGFPQIANYQSGFFSPLLAPLFLLPLPLVAVPYLILRLMLAGWGTYLYARHLSLRHWPAVLAALSFALSGWMIQYVNNQHLVIDLLLPFLLLFLDRLARFRRLRDLLLLWLVVLLILLGGQPSSALFTLFLGLAYGAWRWAVGGWGRSRREFFLVAVPLLLALLASLIQTLPFLEFIPRAWTFHQAGFGTQHLPLATAITLLAPGFFGWTGDQHLPVMMMLPYLGAVPLAYALAGLLHPRRLSPTAGFFVVTALICLGFIHGLPVFDQVLARPGLNRLAFFKYCQPLLTFAVAVLAGWTADRLQPGERKSGFALALTFLFLAAVFDYNWFPAARSVRLLSCGLAAAVLIVGWLLQARPAGAGLALLAGLGLIGDAQFNTPLKLPWLESRDPSFLARFRSQPPDFPRLAASEDVLSPLEAAAWQVDDLRVSDAILVGRMIRYLNLLNGHTPKQGWEYLIPYNYTRVVPDPARFQGPLAKLARLRWFLSREPLPANSTLAQILDQSQAVAPGPDYITLNAFDLRGDFRRALYQHPPSRIEVPAAVAAGHAGLKFGLALDPNQWSKPGDGVWFGIFSAGLRRAQSSRRLLFSRNLNPSRRESDRRWVDQELNFSEPGPVQMVTLPGSSAAYDWSGWGDLRWLEEPVLRGRIQDGIRVHENPGAFPLARLLGNWQGARDAEESAVELQAGHDWASWAVVEGVASSPGATAQAPDYLEPPTVNRQPSTEIGQVHMLQMADGYLELSVAAKQAGLLLITENYFPGWQAEANGRPLRIYPADLAFRGVFLEPGTWKVKFLYRPWAFRVGLFSTLVSLLAAGAALLSRRRRSG